MTKRYPGDAVFEAAPEFSQGAADYAEEQRLERAYEIVREQKRQAHAENVLNALQRMARGKKEKA